ncbi:hypothetical protein C8R45DRAFT_167963 [Mycena sanguinolenta]|nr:hypothetical protein C8R45DRAFT_167963 [Mycena sanguinolenta]
MVNFTPSSEAVIPPELIDAIICEVDDVDSLKACSLVASCWRSQSQRILYSTLTVRVDNCAALYKLFTESPHIADYVTSLIMRTVYANLPSSNIEKFRRILTKLRNVRWCTLDGSWGCYFMPADPGPPFDIPPPVLDFLVLQPLRGLSLSCVRIPTSVLWYFLTTVPDLAFREDSLLIHDAIPLTVMQAPVLRSLFVDSTVKGVGPYVVHLQNRRCLDALRHFSFRTPGDEWAAKLVQTASRTLEHIHFNFSGDFPLNLPYLPALRTLQLTFPLDLSSRFCALAALPAWPAFISRTTDTMSSLVMPETFPALAELHIDHHFAGGGVLEPAAYTPLIALLDEALASFPTPPRIRWSLLLYVPDTQYTSFVDAVRRGMPKAYNAGRLVTQAYELDISGKHVRVPVPEWA